MTGTSSDTIEVSVPLTGCGPLTENDPLTGYGSLTENDPRTENDPLTANDPPTENDPLTGYGADEVRALFERYGSGVVEETVLCGADDDGSSNSPQTWLRTYVSANDVDARLALEIGLSRLARAGRIPEPSVRQLSEANWAEAWKAHYKPLRVGEHLVVTPSWCEPDARADDIVVRIDPGMAFGTGLHATTQLCLIALERLVRPAMSVLDVGTGTGVLAIVAGLLGASRVVALDIAAHAAEAARANATVNGATIDVVVGQVDSLPAERFDVVVANLLSVTLIEEARDLAARLRPGGTLIASGVLEDQVPETSRALLAVGLHELEVEARGDWVAIRARAAGIEPVPARE